MVGWVEEESLNFDDRLDGDHDGGILVGRNKNPYVVDAVL